MNGANGSFFVGTTPHPTTDGPGAKGDSGTDECRTLNLRVFHHVSSPIFLLKSLCLLAKPLRISNGAVEVVTSFIELELAGFRSFCRFCEKVHNLSRIHGPKTPGRLESLLKNRERVAAGDHHTGGEVHRIVKALHRSDRFAFENKVIPH